MLKECVKKSLFDFKSSTGADIEELNVSAPKLLNNIELNNNKKQNALIENLITVAIIQFFKLS